MPASLLLNHLLAHVPKGLGQAEVRHARTNALLAERRMGDLGIGSGDFRYTGKPVCAVLVEP